MPEAAAPAELERPRGPGGPGACARSKSTGDHFAAKRADEPAEATRACPSLQRALAGPSCAAPAGDLGPLVNVHEPLRGAWDYLRSQLMRLFRFTVRPPLVTVLVTGIGGRGRMDAACTAAGRLAGRCGSGWLVGVLGLRLGGLLLRLKADWAKLGSWASTSRLPLDRHLLVSRVRYHVRDERVNDRR